MKSIFKINNTFVTFRDGSFVESRDWFKDGTKFKIGRRFWRNGRIVAWVIADDWDNVYLFANWPNERAYKILN